MQEPTVEPGPAGTRFGEIRWFALIDSTNSYLLRESQAGAPTGLVAVASHQTAGRGRRDRRWDSKPGSGLSFSVLLRPRAEQLPVVNQAFALAVVDACAVVGGFRTTIKWPNDILFAGRKLSGILSEVVAVDGDVRALVIGCGINLAWGDDLPEALRERAVSADEITGRTIERSAMLDGVLRAFEQRLGRPDWVLEAYRGRCSTLGQRVRVELADGEVVGTAVDVLASGPLVVEVGDGSRTEVTAADVVHLRPVQLPS